MNGGFGTEGLERRVWNEWFGTEGMVEVVEEKYDLDCYEPF